MAAPPPEHGATTRAPQQIIARVSRDDADARLRAAQEPNTTILLTKPGGGSAFVGARVRSGGPRISYGRDHVLLFLDGLRALDRLRRTEWRVLAAILPLAAYGDNIAPVRATGIARAIGIDKAHASAAIRRLRAANILIARGQPGERLPFLRLSRRLVWRGSAIGYRKAQNADPDPVIRLPARKPCQQPATSQQRRRPWTPVPASASATAGTVCATMAPPQRRGSGRCPAGDGVRRCCASSSTPRAATRSSPP